MKMTRRTFMKSAGAAAALSLLPRLAFANLPTENRFVLVILRGALDGLAAVPPYGDPSYKSARGDLAFNAPGMEDGVLDLDGFYGFNPALQPLLALYQQKQLMVIHAVASPYRERSHFDAQNVLENGTINPSGSVGWLNKALVALNAQPTSAIAINQQVPLVLQGNLQVESWAPKGRELDAKSDYMTKMSALYQQDALLKDPFNEAMQTQTLAQQALPTDDANASNKAKNPDQLYAAARAAGQFLAKDDGPRIAVLEAGGWDTHFRQGTSNGILFNRLGDLAKGLAELPTAMGGSWKKTVVVVVTEFGRTVAENGTGGTDHGTGGMALVMGGAIDGGKVMAQWPGLAPEKLYQNRDLLPTTDLRSVFKTVLAGHLNVPATALENDIFPGSSGAPMLKGILV